MSASDSEDLPKERQRDRGGRRDRGPRGGGDNFRDRSKDRGNFREPRSMKSSQNRVYVSNIPYEYRWQDIKDLFRDEVGDVQFVELFTDDLDKPKGCGIVEFADQASVKKCLEVMQRFEVKGRKLVVKEDNGVTRDKHGSIMSGNSRRNDNRSFDNRDNNNFGVRNDEGKWGNTYGLSPNFLESLKIDPPLGNKVFVANLDYNVDKKKVKEAFKLAGKIVNVDLPLDKDGRIRGFAVVEYDHPVEAVQAISMFHGQSFFDRTITVRMDRANDHVKLPEGLRSVGMGLGPNGEPLKCIPHNLPSSNQAVGNGGIFGGSNNSMPLNSLTGMGALNALQTANLSSLLSNNLGGADISSLVSNPMALANAQQQLAALAAQNVSSNISSNNRGGSNDFGGSNNYNNSDYGQSSANQGYKTNSGSSKRTYDYGTNRLSFSESNANKSFSKKVLISNLPSTVSYKLLNEKCSEFGEIQSFEAKGPGSILLTYQADWQAEKAIKNLDKARIDGRMIDARLFF